VIEHSPWVGNPKVELPAWQIPKNQRGKGIIPGMGLEEEFARNRSFSNQRKLKLDN